MNKLYALFIIEDENSLARMVACSNETAKLTAVVYTPDHMFSCVNDPNDKTLKMRTTKGIYPMYLFREVPYIV